MERHDEERNVGTAPSVRLLAVERPIGAHRRGQTTGQVRSAAQRLQLLGGDRWARSVSHGRRYGYAQPINRPGTKGFQRCSGWASRSASKCRTVGLYPSPVWLLKTSMFSRRFPGLRWQARHGTMPSLREYTEVAGTRREPASRQGRATSGAARCMWAMRSNAAEVERPRRPASRMGLPRVTTWRTSPGARRASSWAYSPPRLHPMMVTFSPVLSASEVRRVRNPLTTDSVDPMFAPSCHPETE